MHILLTGVPGWLGNRFVDVLARGYEGEGPAAAWDLKLLVLKGAGTRGLSAAPGRKIDFIEGDVRDAGSLRKAAEGVDAVIHIAGIIHPKRISDLYAINTRGTENMLAAAAERGARRFVFISSNSVGGVRRNGALMTENDPPCPYLHYGKSKYLAEQAVERYRDRMETVILRPCWYYGPNQPDRQTTFFRMIKKGRPIIFGSGNNLRSMTYLDNLCQAMILATAHQQAAGRTYWIADEKPYATNEIYATVADLLGVKGFRPVHVPDIVSEGCLAADWLLQTAGLYVKKLHVAGEMNKNIACDVGRAQSELGYRPKIALREGMRRSIEWCRRNGVDL
jgi:nucleoside-diphosphate-sugar epimerase